ncbi:MAG TPA: DUF433 domain-containing protein [Verrucomicrobiae bacterium]|nr:DUF433 domain-containing protein [Verrucomicrobiae bacterium]
MYIPFGTRTKQNTCVGRFERLKVVYSDASMARKRITRFAGDILEHPRYSIEEAAAYLHIPKSTLAAWTRGQHYTTKYGKKVTFDPVLELVDKRNGLLSFNNFAEAHILRCTRERNVPLKNVRLALSYVRRALPDEPHPLLHKDFRTYGSDVFIQHLGQTVNATRQGQLAMRKLLGRYLKRLKRDEVTGALLELYPIKTRHLAINPFISAGKPVVKGTGINAMVLLGRLKSGESNEDVAKDYGLTIGEVKSAVKELAAA